MIVNCFLIKFIYKNAYFNVFFGLSQIENPVHTGDPSW